MRRQYIFRLISRVHFLCTGCCTVLFISAWIQSTVIPEVSPPVGRVIGSTGASSGQATPVNVMFNRSVPFAVDVFLLEIQRLALARFSYMTPVFSAGHVHNVLLFPGQIIGQVLQRPDNMPVVRNDEVDQRTRINE
ncbi:MAG TPA: hypothetical protein PK497_01955 [Burkholderiaceae bacterium]|nr:hypothetical protein [Burkholderiaceae bacterium]